MKKAKLLMMGMLLMGVMFSCKDDDPALPDPVLSVDMKAVEMEAITPESPLEIKISSNYPWKASCPAADNWCTVTKEGEEKLLITVTTNLDTVARKTKITVTTGSEDSPLVSYIDLTQKAADPASLLLSVDKLELLGNGETKTITAFANSSQITYTFKAGGAEWCTIVIKGAEITLTAVKNESQDDRTAQAIFTAGEGTNLKTATLDIVQRGQKPYISFGIDTLRIKGGIALNQKIVISSNLEGWKPSIPGISQRKIEFTRVEDTLIVKGDAYFGLEQIMSYVDADRVGGTPFIWKRLPIVWESAPIASLTVKESKVSFLKSGGTQEIEATSNFDLTWENSASEWLTVKKNGNKVSFQAKASDQEQPRTATVTLKAGGDGNVAFKVINVVQFGTKASLEISVESLLLDENGTEQEVSVTASEEWGIVPSPDATWLTVTKTDTKLKFMATKAESSRSTVVKIVLGSGSNLVEKIITVTQNKLYKVGEIYILDGKKIGLVYSVTNGGAHGKVISLTANNENQDYRNIPGGHSNYVEFCKDPSNVGPQNRYDGLQNMTEAKDIHGSDWKNAYPLLAWCEELNKTTGNPGWYVPALYELIEFSKYMTGFDVPFGPGITGEAGVPAGSTNSVIDKIAALNKVITAAGGTPFLDYPLTSNSDDDWADAKLCTSTELRDGGKLYVYIIYVAAGRLFEAQISNQDASDQAAIRAIFKF